MANNSTSNTKQTKIHSGDDALIGHINLFDEISAIRDAVQGLAKLRRSAKDRAALETIRRRLDAASDSAWELVELIRSAGLIAVHPEPPADSESPANRKAPARTLFYPAASVSFTLRGGPLRVVH